MAFFCYQCGECCSHMSCIHRIEHQTDTYTFVLHNLYNGERTMVSVDTDKIPLFDDRSLFLQWPEACPFLREDPVRKKIVCTIHRTRPELCREFECWRLLILDPAGKRAGRIMGTRHLCAEDPSLRELWKAESSVLGFVNDDSWDSVVIRMLKAHGYRVLSAQVNSAEYPLSM
jgi:hypothetical protein